MHAAQAQVYLKQSRNKEALEEALKESDAGYKLYALSMAYFALGRKAESDENLEKLVEKYASAHTFQIAEVYAFRKEKELAFQWLERAYSGRDPGTSNVMGDPLLESVEKDPRYTAFLQKMRLGS